LGSHTQTKQQFWNLDRLDLLRVICCAVSDYNLAHFIVEVNVLAKFWIEKEWSINYTLKQLGVLVNPALCFELCDYFVSVINFFLIIDGCVLIVVDLNQLFAVLGQVNAWELSLKQI
jgi:hypothetical protein